MTIQSLLATRVLISFLLWCSREAVAARRVHTSRTFETFAASDSDTFPDLGRFSERFAIEAYLSRGGQAEVWSGFVRQTHEKVVFRFPFGLCDAGPARCQVRELNNETLEELRSSCALAVEANQRLRLRRRHAAEIEKHGSSPESGNSPEPFRLGRAFRSRARHSHDISTDGIELTDLAKLNASLDSEGKQPQQPSEESVEALGGFVQCVLPVSTEGADPAFEVWSFAGEMTLAEGFFMSSTLGNLSIEDKREVIRTLLETVATLSDRNLKLEGSCCCLKGNVNECTSATSLNWFRSIVPGYVCPYGYEEQPDACGPMSHHDIKFENVMLKIPYNKGQKVKPILIDFGAAARCNAGKAKSNTRDWVPYWLSDLESTFLNPSDCWSYDTYDVGLLWLITELLSNLPSTRLLCNAAVKAGLTEAETTPWMTPWGYAHCSEQVLRRAWHDTRLKEDALAPVHVFVHDLHLHLRKSLHFLTAKSFKRSIQELIDKLARTQLYRNTLKISMPSNRILDEIFALLQECPSFPGRLHSETGREDTLECRFRFASHRLRDATMSRNAEMIAEGVLLMNASCVEMRDNAVNLPQSGNPTFANASFSSRQTEPMVARKVEQRCSDQNMQSLLRLVTSCNVEGTWHFLNASDNATVHSLLAQYLPGGETLLAWAARAGCVQVVRALLQHGASPLKVDHNEITCDGSRHLIAAGIPTRQQSQAKSCTINVIPSVSETWPLPPLLAAASLPGNVEVLSLLLNTTLKRWASIESVSKLHAHMTSNLSAGPNLLSLVAGTGDLAMLGELLDAMGQSYDETVSGRRKTNTVNRAINGISLGDVPLMKAAENGRTETCRELLRVGANPAVKDYMNRTPLMKAVQAGHVDTVQVLGEKAPDAVRTNVHGIGYPLHAAAENGDVRMVENLLDLGADVTEKSTQFQESALHTACRVGSAAPSMVKALARDTRVHFVQNMFGETPLALATKLCVLTDPGNGKASTPAMLSALLDSAPDEVLHVADENGHTPLLIAASEGQLSCLRLIAQHMPVDSLSPEGITALMVAARRGQGPAIKILVNEYGANIRALSLAGFPVAHYVGMRGFPMHLYGRRATLAALVEAAGTNDILQIYDKNGMNVLGNWILRCEPDIVEFLIRDMFIDCNASVAKVNHDTIRLLGYNASEVFLAETLTPLHMVRLRLSALVRKYDFKAPRHRHAVCLEKIQTYLEKLACDAEGSTHISIRALLQARRQMLIALHH